MNVGDGGVLVEAGKAADLEVFADGHDLLRQNLGDLQLGAGVLALNQSRNVSGVVLHDDGADILDERNERSGARAEVGLAVDLDDGADAALVADSSVSHAFGGDTASLLGSLCKALFTEPLNSLVHVAVGLDEGLLAVHHTDVGHFTQFLNISSSKCHGNILLIYILWYRPHAADVDFFGKARPSHGQAR